MSVEDMKKRREALFGRPEEPKLDLGALQLLNEANAANAELAQAVRSMGKDLIAYVKADEAAESELLKQLRADLVAANARLVEEVAARAILQGQLSAMHEAHEMMMKQCDAMCAAANQRAERAEAAYEGERNKPPPQMPEPTPAPAQPKAWLLETRDTQGNPRKVRMTPEY